MTAPQSPFPRVQVDGKFFRLGEEKFYVKGMAYGPFAPNAEGEPFPVRKRVEKDFVLLRELGANLLRVYQTPPRWLLDVAEQHQLKVFIDVPLDKQRCFLDPREARRTSLETVRESVRSCRGHPAVFAYGVANEIPPDVVRWSGARMVAEVIDELIEAAKEIEPDCLCTFTNFPPTEYLAPRSPDFVSFNVYLHHRRSFEGYLARLQMQAEGKPLILAEFGVDSIREGEDQKCAMLSWQIESAFRAGLAGTILFSFTDDWFMAGRQVEDWAMGLTTAERQPKNSFFVVQQKYRAAPYFPLPLNPMVSVIVACYNGAKTLRACLGSLERLHYPEYEVILVDDGSTDNTRQIASQFEKLRYLLQPHHGLSVARNTGLAAACGEIVAFTDADCRADEDWLYYLVGDMLHTRFAGIGGPNLLPQDDSPVAASVLVSPGGPAHVMLTDRIAEHIPGCNMAFYKWVLEEIGCFDPVFRRAGDDVDVCWRLQQRGYRIGFSPSGFVWHYRRSTVPAYLKQQEGYGESEALLERKHPEYFNFLGGSVWRGRIYTAAKFGVVPRRSVIYHGVFGTGYFQTLYAGEPSFSLMLFTSLEYHVLITLPLLVLSVPFHFLWPVPLTSLLLSAAVCIAAASQADLPKTRRRFWSRSLVALLFFLQPIVRGWARYRGRLAKHSTPDRALAAWDQAPRLSWDEPAQCLFYWTDQPVDRVEFVNTVMERLDRQGWTSKADAGWEDFDLEIYGNRWSRVQLTTVMEELPEGKRLIRCRLRSEWSLAATIFFWATLALELLLIGLIASSQPWFWMMLLSMPLFAWFLEQEKNNLQRLVTAFLDEVARQRSLAKVPAAEAKKFFASPKKESPPP
jgi:glycosyltransferase involved in cell wall biosynthesis